MPSLTASPSSAVNIDLSNGTAWSSPTNVLTSNNARARATLPAAGASDFLSLGFNLASLPADALVTKMKVEYEGFAEYATAIVYARLAQGAGSTVIYPFVGPPGPTEAFYEDGAPDDWGHPSWVDPALLKASDFRVQIYAKNDGGISNPVQIDYVRLTIDWIKAPTQGSASLPGASASAPAATARGGAAASAALADVALSAPSAFGGSSVLATAALPSLMLSPPEVAAVYDGNAEASLPSMLASVPEVDFATAFLVAADLPGLIASALVAVGGVPVRTPIARQLNLPVNRRAQRTLSL